MTAASRGEIAAWKQLRKLRHEGYSFRREQSVGRYHADFACLRRRVIVGVDGPVHDFQGRRAKDAARDAWLTREGFVVLRFEECVVLSEANWLADVRAILQRQPEAPFRRRTLPLEGGGQGGGDVVGSDVADLEDDVSDVAQSPLPLTPSPSRGGG